MSGFDPPTGPPVTDPTAHVPVMTDPAPSRRQRSIGLVVVLLLIAAAVAVIFGIALLRNGNAEGGFDLASAAENTAEQPTRVTATIDAGPIDGVTLTGENVPAQQITSVQIQLGGLFDLSVISDAANGELFIGTDMFTELVPDVSTDARWVRVDAAQAASVPGFDELLDAIEQNDLSNTAAIDALRAATTVQELGIEDIDGVRTQHVRATVPFSALLDTNPSLQRQLDQLGEAGPAEVVFDAWITEDDFLRRVAYELELGPISVSTTADIEPLPDDFRLELPDDSEVVDLVDLIGA